jgi:AcrR family transcriptional regulator
VAKIVDKKKKRSEIRDAALEIFARKGFENTTVQEIADKANISKGTIYLYFKTKEDILDAASQEILQQLEGELLQALDGLSDPSDKLSALIKQALDITPEFEQIFAVHMEIRLFHLRNKAYENVIRHLEETLIRFRLIVTEIIEQGKDQGVFRSKVNAQALAICLLGIIDGIVMQYLHDKSGFSMQDVRDEFLKNFFNGLMAKGQQSATEGIKRA